MKNPHGVEPTRFMKSKKDDAFAITSNYYSGPSFGFYYDYYTYKFYDIAIVDRCNRENSCWIDNDGTHGYECHPQLKSSLFVNTAGPDETNYFTVLDYEVYASNE